MPGDEPGATFGVHMRNGLLLATLAFSMLGCGVQPGNLTPIEPGADSRVTSLDLLDFDSDFGAPTGVSVDPRTNDFVFLTSGGIVVIDDTGVEKARFATEGTIDAISGIDGEDYSWTLPLNTFGDIAALGDGTYALPMENMVRRYDPELGTAEDYFCLRPGMDFQVMHNDAIALNLADDEIVGAPSLTENDVLVSNNLVHYRASDVEFESATELGDAFQAKGLVILSGGDEMFAVEGNLLYHLKRDGEILTSNVLDGIEDAQGLAVDEDRGLLFVLDRQASEMKAFSLTDALR